MIIGCGLPLFLIFLAPLLGLSSQACLIIFVIVMFLCHLLMPMHYAHKLPVTKKAPMGGHKEHELAEH